MGSLSSTYGPLNVEEISTVINEEDLRSLIENQLRLLQHSFDNLDLGRIRTFIMDIINAPGAVLFSGVGKSKLIANKISQTLTSLGFNRFVFLCPVAALHGDIGAIFPSDLLVLISKSGSSDELLNLVPCARAKGARLISVTSVQDNHLSAVCDVNVHLPLEKEVCPFGLAPLTSPTIQLVFGDILVAAIMRATGLTEEQCTNNHSVGKIGMRLISKEISQAIDEQVLDELLEKRLRLFKFAFDNLDLNQTLAFIKAILDAPGAVFFSSTAKSDFVANKISQTLTSLGFNRFTFLCPIAALHGDIGALFPSDILVLISKSGSSEELINLVYYARAKGARVISVTSVQNSPISALSDMNVYLPLEKVACSSGLAPLTSPAIQLLFVDIIAAAVMRARGLTKEQYASNHPAGKIGKRLIFKVKDLMKRQGDLPLCNEGDMIMDQLTELTSKGCGCLLVIDSENHLIGTFTDGDLRRTLKASREGVFQLTVGEMCNRHPRTINPNAMAVEAMQKMEAPPSAVQFLPVVDDQNVLIGIITLHGLVSSGL